MSGHFLNRPRPPEVFVDAGKALLVTRRETFDDLVAPQLIASGDGAANAIPTFGGIVRKGIA
jgi:hypothetical protein